MIQIIRAIGQKGQLVLPKDIRDHFNLRPGSEVTFQVEDDQVVLKPVIDPIKFVEGFCNIGFYTKLSTKKIKEIIEEEYDGR